MTRLLFLTLVCCLVSGDTGQCFDHNGFSSGPGCPDGFADCARPRSAFGSNPHENTAISSISGGCSTRICTGADNTRSMGLQPANPVRRNVGPAWDADPVYNRQRNPVGSTGAGQWRQQDMIVPGTSLRNSDRVLSSPAADSFAPQRRMTIPRSMEGVAQLSLTDQRLALQQRTCPVTGQLLGSMGTPIRVSLSGRTAFVCCEACVHTLRLQVRNLRPDTRRPLPTAIQ